MLESFRQVLYSQAEKRHADDRARGFLLQSSCGLCEEYRHAAMIG